MSDEPSTDSLRLRRIGLAALGGGIAVLGVVYIGMAAHYKDTVADGTTVAGKSIGGMTREQAERQVAALTHPQLGKKATVSASGQSFTLSPGQAYRADTQRTLEGLTGFNLSPAALWTHMSDGGEAVTPQFTLDEKALQRAVKAASEEQLDGAPKQGKVKFINGQVVVADSRPGYGVDEVKVASQIAGAWPKKTSFSTDLVEKPADATSKAILEFAQSDATKAMSQPLQVTANGETITMSTDLVSDVISSETVDGKPRIKVDTRTFLNYVLSHSTDMQVAAVDAKIVWTDSGPSVKEGRSGKRVDESKVPEVVAAALVGDHHATLPMTEQKPSVKAADLDPNNLPSTSMARFESKFPTGPSNAGRTHNISKALSVLNGMIVQPGEQFSLLRALGYSLSKEKGYVEAGTLQDGVHVPGMGGGVSQVSTALYNAAFFSGVQLDAHTSHAVYIDRYPMGREATLWNPGVDNKWTNDTGRPILIRAGISDNNVVISFYGTKRYSVTTRTGSKYDVQKPKKRTLKGVKGCEDTVGDGTEGFKVDVWRTLSQGGVVVRTERIHTEYKPDDIVTCEK